MSAPSLNLVVLEKEFWSLEKILRLNQKFVGVWKTVEFPPGGIYLVLAPTDELTFFLYTVAGEKKDERGIFQLVPLSFFADDPMHERLYRPLIAKHLRGELERFGLPIPTEIEAFSK
jgi:hypothetical protein